MCSGAAQQDAGLSSAASLHWMISKGSVDLLYSAWQISTARKRLTVLQTSCASSQMSIVCSTISYIIHVYVYIYIMCTACPKYRIYQILPLSTQDQTRLYAFPDLMNINVRICRIMCWSCHKLPSSVCICWECHGPEPGRTQLDSYCRVPWWHNKHQMGEGKILSLRQRLRRNLEATQLLLDRFRLWPQTLQLSSCRIVLMHVWHVNSQR